MNIKDVYILAKKIFVGFLVYLVPLIIIGGGLLVIRFLLSK